MSARLGECVMFEQGCGSLCSECVILSRHHKNMLSMKRSDLKGGGSNLPLYAKIKTARLFIDASQFCIGSDALLVEQAGSCKHV